MTDERPRLPDATPAHRLHGFEPEALPSISWTLTRYLRDIEQLLEDGRWAAAEAEALRLPWIAVALSDERLRASWHAVQSWCEEWISSDPADDSEGIDAARVCRLLAARQSPEPVPSSGSVPTHALRAFRLRRHVRVPAGVFVAERYAQPTEEAEAAVAICTALVEATRRWYGLRACHDATVQANLARLAVLR